MPSAVRIRFDTPEGGISSARISSTRRRACSLSEPSWPSPGARRERVGGVEPARPAPPSGANLAHGRAAWRRHWAPAHATSRIRGVHCARRHRLPGRPWTSHRRRSAARAWPAGPRRAGTAPLSWPPWLDRAPTPPGIRAGYHQQCSLPTVVIAGFSMVNPLFPPRYKTRKSVPCDRCRKHEEMLMRTPRVTYRYPDEMHEKPYEYAVGATPASLFPHSGKKFTRPGVPEQFITSRQAGSTTHHEARVPLSGTPGRGAARALRSRTAPPAR